MRKLPIEKQIPKILPEVEASLSFEGLYLTEKEKELIHAALRGDISRATFLKKARELAEKQ